MGSSESVQPAVDLPRREEHGTDSALVGDESGRVDDVQALGPGGVDVHCLVCHRVDCQRERVVEPADEVVGGRETFIEVDRLCVADIFGLVFRYLPFIDGMRLRDIDGQKSRLILMAVVNLVQMVDRPSERGSREASKDQDERFLANEIVEA